MATTLSRTGTDLFRPMLGALPGTGLLLVLALLLASPRELPAQAIQGTLVDAQTRRPVAAGTVTLLAEDSVRVAEAATDSAGAFVLKAARAGAYRLRAQRLGYATSVSPALELEAGDTLRVEFRLSTEGVLVSPIVVTARPRRLGGALDDFYERARRRAWGSFVTREDIEERNPLRTSDLLRTMPGVRLVPARFGSGYAVLIRGRCSPAVYLDGMRVRLAGATVDDLVHPQDLEGIEVYRSAAEVPGEYGLGSGCGAVLLWTRRGP